MLNIRKYFQKNKYKKIIYIIVLFLFILVIMKIAFSSKNKEIKEESIKITPVFSQKIKDLNYDGSLIKTVGSVKAELSIDVVALSPGTVKGVYFEVGNEVGINSILAELNNNSSLTNLNNAQTNFLNTENNFQAIQNLNEQSIKQAGIGIQNAQERVSAAEINLKTIRQSLENAKALKIKNNADTLNSAQTSYFTFLNKIHDLIDQSNNVLPIKDEIQIDEIKNVLGVKDLSSLNEAKKTYALAEKNYNNLKDLQITSFNITEMMEKMADNLKIGKKLTDDTVLVLENTISSSAFSQSSLDSLKNTFYNLRSGIISSQTQAENLLYSLENLDLLYNSEIDALENSVLASENQLKQAQTALENSLINLESAKKSAEQQNLSSKSGIDNARGQYNLALSQAKELSIKAPISGIITQKYIEIGAEINPGQKIAEISQNDNLKIEASLSPKDIYKIDKNQEILINDIFKGHIISINPAADPISKKVKVTILFNNENKDLIQGTFVEIKISTKKLSKTNSDSFYIPLSSVIITQNEKYIFGIEKEEDGSLVAQKIIIESRNIEGELIEILNTLNPEMEVITEGAKLLKDGEAISIKN
jgi:RND family efflux transporter MFP subunit